MTTALWGGLLGALIGSGLLLVVSRLLVLRRPSLELRVLSYLRDLPAQPSARILPGAPTSAAAAVFAPMLRTAADGVERILGGAVSVRRRLERAGIELTVPEFRIQQVLWGLIGFAIAAAYFLLRALGGDGNSLVAVLACTVSFILGVLLRDNHLSAQVKARERRILAELPALAELLALAVAAGESPVSALDRVVRRSGGELSVDLAGVLAQVRTGVPVATAFDGLAASTGLPLVSRFAQGIAVAVERGTPLADVLHAQAADVREAGRRQLVEIAAGREVAMMVPVVFLVLPVTVLFAFWPGVVGLSLTTP